MTMNKYIKGPTETLVGDFTGTIYTEFENGYAVRQATWSNNRWYTSREDYIEGFGPTLLEGSIEDLDLSESTEISQEEFESIWRESEN